MDEVIYNRFIRVFDEWVCIHDEDIHFPVRLFPPHKPAIKLCGSTLRIRANDAFTKLPKQIQEAMVAHELGHREMNHADSSMINPFYRMGCVFKGTVDEREVKADRYACKLVPRKRYIAVLEELVEQYFFIGSSATELKRRIKVLKSES